MLGVASSLPENTEYVDRVTPDEVTLFSRDICGGFNSDTYETQLKTTINEVLDISVSVLVCALYVLWGLFAFPHDMRRSRDSFSSRKQILILFPYAGWQHNNAMRSDMHHHVLFRPPDRSTTPLRR